MNNERASLKQALKQQEEPSSGIWEKICEQLDREALGRTLYAHSENPPKEAWDKIRPMRRVSTGWIAAASITAGIACGMAYWFLSSSPATQVDQIAAVTASPLPQQEEIAVHTYAAPNNNAPSIIDQPAALKTTTIRKPVTGLRDENKYVLVAAKNGKPIRVPVKWSSLSCCLSGESATPECRMQQTAWHSELACSELGFQADPVLGLMELIEATDRR